MHIEQRIYDNVNGWQCIKPFKKKHAPQLVLVFGCVELFSDKQILSDIQTTYPSSLIVGCTTAGEIVDSSAYESILSVSAIFFEKSYVKSAMIKVDEQLSSYDLGTRIVQDFSLSGLKHILLFCAGVGINGGKLVDGVQSRVADNIKITGGIAGNSTLSSHTLIMTNQGEIYPDAVVAVGLYGAVDVGYGVYAGWDSFGIERHVSKSEHNIVYEIDNYPALSLYKSFLGDLSKDLPHSGLLFPLSVRVDDTDSPVIRTIMGVDETTQSIIMAGGIEEGSYIKLMKTNVDRLIDGASIAVDRAIESIGHKTSSFALLVSCVGRKMVLRQLKEEELDVVKDRVGQETTMVGFYSFGEFSPHSKKTKSTLHNQTMSITLFSEE